MSRAGTSRWLFAPVAALIVLAGYMGLRLGQPVSETQIITEYASRYVNEVGQGAAMTDCLARPGARADVRLTVVCTHGDGTVYRFPVGPRGQLRVDRPAEGEI